MNTIAITTYCCNCGKREQHIVVACKYACSDQPYVIRCKECCAKQIAAVHANESLPVGGTSCSEEYALRPLIGSRGIARGACGGGIRVIRKGDSFS